jgi:hypothetical protein
VHVNHEHLLAKLSQRVAVGKSLNKQALAKAGRNQSALDAYRSLDAGRVLPRKGNRPILTAMTKTKLNEAPEFHAGVRWREWSPGVSDSHHPTENRQCRRKTQSKIYGYGGRVFETQEEFAASYWTR